VALAAPATPGDPFPVDLILALLGGCGLALFAAALIPDAALRTPAVYRVLVPHRVDIALVGVAILLVLGTIRVLAS